MSADVILRGSVCVGVCSSAEVGIDTGAKLAIGGTDGAARLNKRMEPIIRTINIIPINSATLLPTAYT